MKFLPMQFFAPEGDAVTAAINAAVATLPTEKAPAIDVGAIGDDTPAAEATDDTPAADDTAADDSAPATDGSAAPAKEDDADAAKEPEPLEDGHKVDKDGNVVDKDGKPVVGKDGQKKKRGPMPYHRHEAVLTNVRAKHAEEIKQLNDKYAGYEAPEFKENLGAMMLADREPERFAEILLSDPRYTAIFEKRFKAPASTPAEVKEITMPKPNVVYEDGRLGYDEAGATQLAQFHAQEATKALRAELAELRGVVDPVKKERDEQAKYTQILEERRKANVAALDNARKNWKGFTENEEAIKALVLHADPKQRLTLDQAYQKVVVHPKMETDKEREDRIYQKVLETLKAEGKAGQVVPKQATPAAAVVKKDPNAPVDLGDVITGAMAAAGLK